MQWIILAIVVMAALGYWNYQRTQGQQQALQSAGFVVSDDLKGNPKLLVSTSQRQLAVVRGGGYLRLDFAQVQDVSVVFDSHESGERNYRLRLALQGAPESTVEIGYQDEFQTESAGKQLKKILGL